jgi:hypothetical protein
MGRRDPQGEPSGRLTGVRALIPALLIGLAGPAAAALTDPVEDFVNQPVPPLQGKALTSSEVRDAIVAAATARQWKIDYVRAGALIGRLNVAGRHLAEVSITYSPERYSVVYRDSVNLNYRSSDRSIHANYNKWVGQLVEAINASLGKPPSPLPEPPRAPLRLN